MKSNRRGHGALPVVAAGALALSLAACDQIQSLWKSEGSSNPAIGPVAQPAPQPAEGKIEVARASEIRKAVEIPKAPIDEDSVLAAKVKSAFRSDPVLKLLAIDAGASNGAVTLYGTAPNREQREKAARVASGVPGVKSVRNELVIVAGS